MNVLLQILAQNTVTPARSGAPLQVLAAVLLMGILCGLIYVLRHLNKIRSEVRSELPAERGPRNNIILIVCAITFAAVALLLFLLVKA